MKKIKVGDRVLEKDRFSITEYEIVSVKFNKATGVHINEYGYYETYYKARYKDPKDIKPYYPRPLDFPGTELHLISE